MQFCAIGKREQRGEQVVATNFIVSS